MCDNTNLETCVAELEKSPDYKVLRKFTPKTSYTEGDPGNLVKGIILDTETTGRDPAVDKLVELGMVAFSFNPVTGDIHEVLGTFNELEDPGIPIPPEASRVNKITDDMVVGKKIDDMDVELFCHDAELVIAHNASFDRPVMENRFPLFKSMSWACSLYQIDWEAEEMPGKLEYLATKLGMFYEAHRAEIDCRVLLDVLARPLPISGKTGLSQLLVKSKESECLLYAMGTPFEAKDVLKKRGYRWFPGEGNRDKAWYTSISGEDYEAEAAWLAAEIYKGKPFRIEREVKNALVRFSQRAGNVEMDYR